MVIKNGQAANEKGLFKADIRISGETITEIGENLNPINNEKIINADGKIIIPGGVDVHTHMDLDLGFVRATDDFYTGTVAAAFGGTTTIVDHMAFGKPGSTIHSRVDVYHQLADDKVVIDYSFHGVIDRVDDSILNEIDELISEGITSHKFYLTYDGKISDCEVIKLMEHTAKTGVILAVHAENDGMINYLRKKFISEGKFSPIYHALSRPPESEAEAVSRMTLFASKAGQPLLYFVHISSGLSLDYIHNARKRGQKNIFVETCPQYLFLDDSLYKNDDGLKYIMSPPLRDNANREKIWEGIYDGQIDTVGTDHCPFFYNKEKQLGKYDFTKAPGGAPGVEARIPLMYSQVATGKLEIGKFVSLCCAEPARLFGMYPKKGVIAVGSDADLVIIDPTIKKTMTFELLHENCDYTPYEGIPINGYPVMTISRGEVIVQDGEFIGKKGRGKFIKRNLPKT
jgi:dihydropyrimidinase